MEVRAGRERPYRARVRWVDPTTKRRPSKSTSMATPEEAQAWIDAMVSSAHEDADPAAATTRLAEYGESVRTLALRDLERKTLDPHLAGWRKRMVPALGHIPMRRDDFRRVHGRADRRGFRRRRRGHRPGNVDVDRPPANHARPRWPNRQGHQGLHLRRVGWPPRVGGLLLLVSVVPAWPAATQNQDLEAERLHDQGVEATGDRRMAGRVDDNDAVHGDGSPAGVPSTVVTW